MVLFVSFFISISCQLYLQSIQDLATLFHLHSYHSGPSHHDHLLDILNVCWLFIWLPPFFLRTHTQQMNQMSLPFSGKIKSPLLSALRLPISIQVRARALKMVCVFKSCFQRLHLSDLVPFSSSCSLLQLHWPSISLLFQHSRHVLS